MPSDARPAALDPTTVQVIGNNLLAIADEMGIVLIKAAYSTNIKERADCSAAILDASGETIAQAEHIPMHLGSMLGLVGELRKRYVPSDIRPGDVFILNDPYSGGGTHLFDVTVAAPFFSEGELLGFVANIAHHSDVGGNKGRPSDIFGEGLRIPPTKLFDEGHLRQDVFDIILTNWRLEDERRGDLRAQFASVRVALDRLEDLCRRYGPGQVLGATRTLADQAELQARAAIRGIPSGRYEFTDYIDDDGRETTLIPIHVAVSVEGDQLLCDFAGTSPQVPGNINATWYALAATVYYAVKAVVDPSLPANSGYFRAIKIEAPEGTIVNCSEPAAVGFRTDTCQRIADAVLGALAQAVPDRVIAACHSTVTTMTFFGDDPSTGRFYVYPEVIGGGFGARPVSDGPDAVQVHVTNTSNLPVESLEAEYPLLVERYELVPDSGGAGRFRGGLGLLRQYRLLAPKARFGSKGDRQETQPWGLAGGLSGRGARLTLNPDGQHPQDLGSKTFDVPLEEGDVVQIITPGGGGHGDPATRDPKLLERDLREGKVTMSEAALHYGYEPTATSDTQEAGRDE